MRVFYHLQYLVKEFVKITRALLCASKIMNGKRKTNEKFEIYKELALIPYRRAEKLIGELNVDLNFYKMAKFADVDNPKEYFLYGVLRIVKKACLSLLHKSDFVSEKTDEDNKNNSILDEMCDSMIDDENYLIRRLLETLVNVINFRDSNENDAYRIFLNSENLELFIRKQNEFDNYYNIRSLNVNSSIEEYYSRIKRDIKESGKHEIWFLNMRNFKNIAVPIFRSVFNRFNKALTLANPEERIIMGLTYNRFYSTASLSIHGTISSSPLDYSFETTQAYFSYVSLICDLVINATENLIGIEKPKNDKYLVNKSIPKIKELMGRHEKRFENGDVVLAYGDLAEIIEKIESKYDYISYKVKYLGKPPLPEILADYYPSEHIIELINKNSPKEFLKKIKNSEDLKRAEELLNSQSDEKLFDALKKALIEIDKRGLLNKVLYGR